MSTLTFSTTGADAQNSFKKYLSDAVRGGVPDVELESSETTFIPFSVVEEYKLKAEIESSMQVGVIQKTLFEESYVDNPDAFTAAVARMLTAEMNSETVADQCENRIKSYKYLEHRGTQGSLLLHRGHQRALHHQSCQTCGSEGQTQCLQCDQNGQVTCHGCNGTRRIRCGVCHGVGRLKGQHGTDQREQWDRCGSCNGGYNHCYTCHLSGLVNCHTCGGKKWLACQPCSGTGWFTQIVTPIVKAAYSHSYLHPSNLDESATTDLSHFLKKTDWQVHDNAALLRIDCETDPSAGVVRIKHRFEAPRTCYYATVHKKRAYIRHFGHRNLLMHMGGIVEQLVSADLDELRSIVSASKLSDMKSALRSVLASGLSQELIAAVNNAPADFSYSNIADNVNRSVGVTYTVKFLGTITTALDLARRRRRLIGAGCTAIGATAVVFLAPRLVCAYPAWFIGKACLSSASTPATQTSFAINAAQLGLVVGLVVAASQFVAQFVYFSEVAKSHAESLEAFAKRYGCAHGRISVIGSMVLGGLIAFGVAKVATL